MAQGQAGSGSGGRPAGSGTGAGLEPSLRAMVAQEVQRAFAQMGEALARAGSSPPAPSGQGSGAAASPQAAGMRRPLRRLLNASRASSGSALQAPSGGGSGRGGAAPGRGGGGTVPEAAALMAQAQAAFRQELTENLKKLKQVISESQEIARKMEAVLGQGKGGGQG